MTTEFLGKQLSGPFTIPSGIVTTAPAIIQRVMDTMPEVGVITTKSIGFEPRLGNREPVYSQYAPGCFVNAVGLTNPGVKEALQGLQQLSVPADREPTTSDKPIPSQPSESNKHLHYLAPAITGDSWEA